MGFLTCGLFGHATIELTVSTYGRWLKKKAPGALDLLDSVGVHHSGSKVVAEAVFAVGAVGTLSAGVPYIQPLTLEPAIRIERTTCGLRIPNPPDCIDTQSPHQHSNSNDLDEDSPQMGLA